MTMDSEKLIRTVNQTAALKISSLRGVYERKDMDVYHSGPTVNDVVDRLRRFAVVSQAGLQQVRTD